MKKVTFTICIPTYNSENIVERAINSAINQTFHNYNILIIDDNSSDLTPSILQKYKKHANVEVIINETNIGVTANWNKCLKLATGNFIVFVHHDDSIKETYLENAATIINNNSNIGIVAFQNQTQTSHPFDNLILGRDYFDYIFRWKYIIPPSQAIFINLPSLSYDNNFSYSPEADIYLQILQKDYNVYFSDKRLSIRNSSNWTNNISTRVYYKWRIFKDRIEILKKWTNHKWISKKTIYLGLLTTTISAHERNARTNAMKIKDADLFITSFHDTMKENNWFGLPKHKQLIMLTLPKFFYFKKYITSFVAYHLNIK